MLQRHPCRSDTHVKRRAKLPSRMTPDIWATRSLIFQTPDPQTKAVARQATKHIGTHSCILVYTRKQEFG